MRKMINIVLLLVLAGCGSGEVSEPVSVAGNYICVDGCFGDCLFSDLELIQDGQNISTIGEYVGCDGILIGSDFGLGDKDYEVSCKGESGQPDSICSGILYDGGLTANCESITGLVCQTATYTQLPKLKLIAR